MSNKSFFSIIMLFGLIVIVGFANSIDKNFVFLGQVIMFSATMNIMGLNRNE